MSSTLIIAIDGTSGSGKSSTSRAVAEQLGLRYLDTGAMFRAMAWWVLEQRLDPHDGATIAARCGEPEIRSGTDPRAPTITADGRDVSVEIRTAGVTGAVSPVSAVPEVRSRLLHMQRDLIGDGGIVVEGRDIGTVVAPQARVKVYLNADPHARAARRAAEQGAGNLADTREQLLSRDRIDSARPTAPLSMAADAIEIDSTSHSLEEVVSRVIALAEAATSE